jgi:hypothetical protein
VSKKHRVITTQDLADQLGTPYPRPVLLCPLCLQTWSANKGDYFWRKPEEPFECERCWEPLVLVTERTVYERIAV